MKYVVFIGDGMSDRPVPELNDRTPLEVAATPNLDFLAREGALGLVRNVPQGMPCGSDVANLSILGYSPKLYYTGRSPLEAASIGVSLKPEDVSFRCNLVTLGEEGNSPIMADYSAGHIETEEAAKLIATLNEKLSNSQYSFHPGVSYRHLMVWKKGQEGMETTPPHDIAGRAIESYLPRGQGADVLVDLIARSWKVLKGHRVNIGRKMKGLAEANSIWLWGQGRVPQLPSFVSRHKITASMITAVDLLKGIAAYTGMEIIRVPGATGYIDTNYAGKVKGALESLERHDLAYLHIEAPDEMGHAGDWEKKIMAIEDFDSKVVGPTLEGLGRLGDFRVVALPDHSTPVFLKTHSADPVPFAIYPRGKFPASPAPHICYSERCAAETGLFIEDGTRLLDILLER